MALGQPLAMGSQAMHCQRASRVWLVANLLVGRFYAAKYRPPLRMTGFRRCEIKARI